VERHLKTDLTLFGLLLALGVLGRWFQPDWNVTPIVAVATFAGYYFRRISVAWLATLAVMTASNLLLPAYNNYGVMLVVFGMFLLPAALGRWVRGQESYARLAICGLLPAMLFFVATNFAVWYFGNSYEPTWAGLVHCYSAGLPFFRAMLLGDVFFLAVVFGSFAACRERGLFARRELAPVRVRRHD
jgi:hypothetical protein